MSGKTSCFRVNGVLISANAKTGYSINVDSCEPTVWCLQHCYRRWRTQELIDRLDWDSTPNTGPITWKTQRESYTRNERTIIELAAAGRLAETASKIAERLEKLGVTHLRGNGTGDLFPELTMFYYHLAAQMNQTNLFLFSRKPVEIYALRDACDNGLVPPDKRPFVIGSTDPSTATYDLGELIESTRYMNGRPVLAYATALGGAAGCAEIDRHPALEHLLVVFGYHSNQLKTKLGHRLECPATAGGKIKCKDCRRCYGEA